MDSSTEKTDATTSGGSPPAVLIEPEHDPEQRQELEQEEESLVLQDLRSYLGRPGEENVSLFDKSTTAIPVAAIKALLGVVQRSRSGTMMGLQDELKQASDLMVNTFSSRKQRSYIALQSGCELFLKYITRTFLELPDFEACRKQVLERGERFQMISLAARDRISASGSEFIPSNSTVLIHGWSRVVAAILLQASKTKHFDLIILQGRPDCSGMKAAKSYALETNIPVTVVPDAAMACVMERVDVVLVGAEGVFENGGIVNKLGTYAMATCAQALGKPFYVAAESYKFARLYPLQQSDVYNTNTTATNNSTNTSRTSDSSNKEKQQEQDVDNKSSCIGDDILMTQFLPDNVRVENPPVDFTPAKFITLLFTDLGVLTPSAVSDELIRLYQ